MKVHHCFIRLIQHYKFSILCQFPPLSHKPYDKLHTLLKFPNLDNITHDKNEGLSPPKAGQIQVVTKMAITFFFFFLNLNDKALEVLGAMILRWEAERSQQAQGSCRGERRRELTFPQHLPAQASHWHGSWTHPQPADTGTPWLGHLNRSKCRAPIRPLRCCSRAMKL